ncbi:hydantoinase B/oxoprolinase family protein [Shimia marina]|uniref:Acetophenone carboxylase gamma subunit n=1 Tax=Shimia marina TaxID=321267 RepID=A0A0P1FGC7_9RHOB|nr:hydantoinase B/oxoprolinase family protein [Shimia marina]CUH54216.1 Acetophenone carboxylase gamma subunit [Shimia marina]SFD97859.1 5-oxoprolinase (ATP-hydrolysing) [Shimia marina]
MSKEHSGAWQFWVDRGGTFTDIVAKAPDGHLQTHKLLSENPESYNDAAVHGIRQLLKLPTDAAIPAGAIDSVKMGTTVATNALLERKGARTVLLITKGLRDLLRIGYQNRPSLFALNIELPELLYDEVIEIEERLDADGNILTPLDLPQASAALKGAHQAGYRSVAVALMHSYRFPDHEKALGQAAQALGFTQISLSHETSPLIKLVGRGDTAVVDAYLSPILRRYVDQVATALDTANGGCGRLLFMQSNGGLTDARLFQGRDAILSGPAGGVVGMVRSAAELGFEKLIGFDMGGTSTDVCHYAGEYERSFETEVAGVRMRAPMMSIHTVAAGGGSILSFRDGRMQVGPESAGANPGPCAYRRGGPLTVTDCNVLLGKLQAAHFPHVFGPNGDLPLDEDAVREKFNVLRTEIGTDKSVEELAEGFLRIAVENMANAIKKISVQRGYDVTQYTMNCFGGAGGQHACLVADALGMESIFIHPFAGVLSAFGMGLADIRAMRESQLGCALDAPEAATQLAILAQAARTEVAEQGVSDADITVTQAAHIRPAGAQQSLSVPYGDIKNMRTAFVSAHKQRFGFAPDTSDLIIDVVVAEAIGQTGEPVTLPDPVGANTTPAHVRLYTGGRWQDVPLVDRETLSLGQSVTGPAILTEPTGTNMIEEGWQATCAQGGNLVLKRVVPLARSEAIGTSVDPVMLEVFNNLFMSIAEQMGATLANTAYSVNIKERYDFSCAIFDQNGDLVANAPHVPVHLGSMSESVRTILRLNAGKIRPGDVFMMNNPYNGGTHLPDVTVITPVFAPEGEQILYTVASRGHHADIGGKTPGSAPPDSRHIEEEGILIDNFLLVNQGTLQEEATRTLLASGPYPCRNIDQNMADLAAQIAANETGAAELRKITKQFSHATVQAYMEHVQDNAEESVRRVLDVLHDCAFSYPLDSGAKIEVSITVDKANRSATLDFTGTSGQSPTNYNAPLAICRAVVLYVFRTLVGSDIPMNEGCMKPLSLIVPEGCMINPKAPAAVISGNTEVSQAIADTLYGALGVIAGSQGTMNNFVYGNDTHQNYETICGGTGAGEGFDGTSAVHSHMTNTRMTDPEVLETRFPVQVEEFSIRQGSGGAGQWSGGEGILRRLRFNEPMTVTVLSSHRIIPPHGTAGGAPGGIGINRVQRADGRVETLKGNDQTELTCGDVFIMETPGGGGFGPV